MRSFSARFTIALLLVTSFVQAEDINQVFGRVNQLVTSKNYPKALEELSFARSEIEKLHGAQLQTYFPDQVAGFAGQKSEAGSILGMSNVERLYTRGQTDAIKVSLLGTNNASGGLGNLAALGRMAAMFGGQGTGSETIRVSGRTATLEKGQGVAEPKLTVYLDSGSILELELIKGKDIEALKALAGGLNLDGLDSYLRGTPVAAK